MIAALWSAFILPLTWVEVSGSFGFAGKIQELLLQEKQWHICNCQ
jgi:hypothetical protein